MRILKHFGVHWLGMQEDMHRGSHLAKNAKQTLLSHMQPCSKWKLIQNGNNTLSITCKIRNSPEPWANGDKKILRLKPWTSQSLVHKFKKGEKINNYVYASMKRSTCLSWLKLIQAQLVVTSLPTPQSRPFSCQEYGGQHSSRRPMLIFKLVMSFNALKIQSN